MAAHNVHTDTSGKHQWTEEGGHCACGGAHATTPIDDVCPQALPLVVLRCRCGDPTSHPEAHCPLAEIDTGASYQAVVSFQ